MVTRRGPILIEEEADAVRAGPAEAPPVPDAAPAASGQAMRTMAALAARPPSRLGRWFRRALGTLFVFVLSVATWSAVTALLAANPLLGWIATVLVGAVLVLSVALALRELSALARLKRVGDLQAAAGAALASADLEAARGVVDRIDALYARRAPLDWHRARLAERRGDLFDADALMGLAESEMMRPLDMAARAEIEAAARQVAAVTAIVPLALADVAAALVSNLRMIRRIAEIYGGRAGTLGAWRLTRAVLTHLVATGAVAVGDDLIGSVAGGSMLTKISRRFGEGIVNGALTARVGVAAMEVCRPLPFVVEPKPQVHRIIGRALSGVFPQSRGD
ncbi:YcjF family protein [Palleronia rufa]|uniref:YcjF family protein n=1 Tax=Palleronia rufa TaxID=1530186 RepID=UPI000561CF23|nr:TIGR01620 family protein [Palleronia rufa]